jgi:hypothetical protein
MKPIYVTLIAVGTGIAGFVGGTSLGLWGGAVSGGFVGGLVGSATGACMTVDAATAINILTPDQAEKIGVKLGQDLKANGTKLEGLNIQGTTASCARLIRGIDQAGK